MVYLLMHNILRHDECGEWRYFFYSNEWNSNKIHRYLLIRVRQAFGARRGVLKFAKKCHFWKSLFASNAKINVV